MNVWRIIKTVVYLVAAALLFIFHEGAMEIVPYLVGSVIFVYATETLAVAISTKKILTGHVTLFEFLIQILIGVILFLVAGDTVKVCVTWGIWSILRESKEITEAVNHLLRKKPGLLNAIESIIIIVMSFFMVLEPTEHHIHTHIFLLGAEFICNVLFMNMNYYYDRYIEGKKLRKSTYSPTFEEEIEKREGDSEEEEIA